MPYTTYKERKKEERVLQNFINQNSNENNGKYCQSVCFLNSYEFNFTILTLKYQEKGTKWKRSRTEKKNKQQKAMEK